MTQNPGGSGCSGRCASCPAAAGRAPREGLRGGRLVLASLFLFLFPLVSALAGAVWAGRAGWGQLASGLAGFFGALFLAKAVLLLREGRRR